MKMFAFLLVLLISLLSSSSGNDTLDKKSERQPRNFDNVFSEYGSYVPEDQPEPPLYSDAGSKPPRQRQEDKTYENLKGYGVYSPYYPAVYKGYPYYGKGSVSKKSPMPAMSPDQMMQMMAMMNSMKEVETGTPDSLPGYLNKIFSDPKSLIAVALIPVSIMLASFIPLVMNYFMNGTSVPSVLSTFAGSKMGRALADADNMDNILENIVKYARKFESHDCIEESLCHFASDNSNPEDNEHVKRIVRAVAKIVKTEWLGHSRLAKVLSAIKHKNCSNVCEKNKTRRKKENILM